MVPMLSMFSGMVSVPTSFTAKNALSPMWVKLLVKKVGVSVVFENAVLDSNADAPIAVILYALAGFPAPLYVVFDPAYVSGIVGKVPQLASVFGYLVAFTPMMESVLFWTDNTTYVKWVSVMVVMGDERWFVTISFIYIKINGTNKRNK
jgi:hypothetical protein